MLTLDNYPLLQLARVDPQYDVSHTTILCGVKAAKGAWRMSGLDFGAARDQDSQADALRHVTIDVIVKKIVLTGTSHFFLGSGRAYVEGVIDGKPVAATNVEPLEGSLFPKFADSARGSEPDTLVTELQVARPDDEVNDRRVLDRWRGASHAAAAGTEDESQFSAAASSLLRDVQTSKRIAADELASRNLQATAEFGEQQAIRVKLPLEISAASLDHTVILNVLAYVNSAPSVGAGSMCPLVVVCATVQSGRSVCGKNMYCYQPSATGIHSGPNSWHDSCKCSSSGNCCGREAAAT